MLQLYWDDPHGKGCWSETFTTSGPYAGHDRERLVRRLKSLHRRHIEANLYVDSDRTERVGGVENTPGVLWNGRHVQWCWWYEPDLFQTPVALREQS